MDPQGLLDVIVIGAGFAGICALVRLREEFPHATTQVFEKAADVGGTWLTNTYPGLSCDIPSQLYSYSFALNPDWSTTYATQPEILAYIRRVVSAYDGWRYIHLEQECLSAEWSIEKRLWQVTFLNHATEEIYLRQCRFLITAVGFAHTPKGPEDILNIKQFSGRVFHSATWDHFYDFGNKHVVVVGNGCSANQFIPWLVKRGGIRSLVQTVRSAHWIAPKDNHIVSEKQKWLLRNLPSLNWLLRFWLALKFDIAFHAFRTTFLGRLLRKPVQAMITGYMQRTAPVSYHPILIPEFPFGAKRPVMDHGYLKSLHDEQVQLVRSHSLEVIRPNRVRLESGDEFHADVIILANGFKTQQLLTPMIIKGVNGRCLPAIWQEPGQAASAYMGVAVAGFPNLFLLTGPNTLPSGHSTLISIECSVEYILRLLKHATALHLHKHGTNASLQVKEDAQAAYNQHIRQRLKGLVYTPEVPNWYIDRRTGQNTLIWPGGQFEFWWSRCIKPIQSNDFEVLDRDGL